MQSVVTSVLLLIACLLNQVISPAVSPDGDAHGARVVAAQKVTTAVLLRGADTARLPRIVETLLAVHVEPQVAAAAFDRARDALEARGEKLRPTLQTLDVRLQV